jgi:nitrite reductase/ring-hydroxylating ferredoxin subunit
MALLRKGSSSITKRFQHISKITTISIVLLGVILTLAACNGQSVQTTVKATWIEPQVAGDIVSILVSEVTNNKIVHFNVPLAMDSEIAFMAYDLRGEIYVRANVCPPCRSVGFSLSGDTLVCDTCQTTFEAKTGEGISGACVAYPKAPVPYEIGEDEKIVMSSEDLYRADQNTNKPGWP